MFDFIGSRDLRRFVELCYKYDLCVIVRIGTFDHGEVRNGDLPDWLYGKPFEARTAQEGFLQCATKLYQEIYKQIAGLYFKQGGPIIAAQIDNEYIAVTRVAFIEIFHAEKRHVYKNRLILHTRLFCY